MSTETKTRATVEEHVACRGEVCPFCGGKELKGGFMGPDQGLAVQEVSCYKCGRRWQDEYRLTGYRV